MSYALAAKLLVAAMLVGSSTQVFAEAHCLGFAPEAKLVCNNGGEIQKIHAFEESQCAAGRDGVLNDSIPIQKVDGPFWTDEADLAQVTFEMNSQTVTLGNCSEVEL